jgi:DNA (cytosine-5)-methyltransferase 1
MTEPLRVGSICSGYGGLDQAVKQVFPHSELMWVADNDAAASELLSIRYPNVPNLGDIKKVDWASVPPIDCLVGGYPCQPFSDAGFRAGHEDRRDLIPDVLEAIRVLRPRFILLENVAGHRRRGFGRVLGGLAALGFDARWHSVRAAEAGAPHLRERVFILAHPHGG